MSHYSEEKIQYALKQMYSMIQRCEKFQPKFKEGGSQFSLLKNRIHALKIACSCLELKGNDISDEDLEKAFAPIESILYKTSKARSKYEIGSTQYKRFTPTIEVMNMAIEWIELEKKKRKDKNE